MSEPRHINASLSVSLSYKWRVADITEQNVDVHYSQEAAQVSTKVMITSKQHVKSQMCFIFLLNWQCELFGLNESLLYTYNCLKSDLHKGLYSIHQVKKNNRWKLALKLPKFKV